MMWGVSRLVPPGSSGDAALLVETRGIRGLESIACDHPGRRVLAVAHGTLIRYTLAAISGHDARHYPRLDNASSSVVRFDADAWGVVTVGGAPADAVLAEVEAAMAEADARLRIAS